MELGTNLFQFNIPNPDDKVRIAEGGPWMIDNQMLVLNRWSAGIEENYKAFLNTPLWVQVWTLSVHWLSKEVGRKIGAVFKEVKEMVIPQSGGKEGRHLKILALTNLSKPLLRGTMVKLAGFMKWVAFKYERCPDFYYNCGIVGYSERSCKEKRTINGEMVEQERIETQINERLLETLKTTDKEGKNNQDPMKEMEDMRIKQGLGEPPIELGDKESAQGCSKGSLCLDKGKLDLSLVIQAEEVKQIPTEIEEMEEDRGLDLQEEDQENRVRVITVGELVIQ
ncbi:uncharacterized protein LOC113756236 [Coffea eugenioides]|uniref:uncharacterized protein LOC113756236 n=1 Tax=Coffea eugenioides TaxID=49369 RepID=UPI000F6078B3|nr:uncharacterized protein LOC113756236 [Coffea eugenioides]